MKNSSSAKISFLINNRLPFIAILFP